MSVSRAVRFTRVFVGGELTVQSRYCFSIYSNSDITYSTKKLIRMISLLATDANRNAIFPELPGGK